MKSKTLNKPSMTSRTIKNVFLTFLSTFIGKVGSLIFTILIARKLFPELFGIYSLALTIILILATFTDLGVNTTLIRYLAESLKKETKEKEKEARSRLYFLFNLKIMITSVIAFILFLSAKQLAIIIFKKPMLTLPLQLGAIYLFSLSLYSFFSSIFYALQQVQWLTAGEFIFQLLRILFVFIFFSFYKNVGTIFIAISLSFFIATFLLFLVLFRKYPFLLKGPRFITREERKRLLSFFSWLTIANISLVFFVHIDMLMLGILLPSPEFAGFYHAIFSIVTAVAAFVSFGSVLLPVFTILNKGKLEKGFNKVIKYTGLISIPASIGLAFVITPAIKLIYGSVYIPQEYRLAIIITSCLLSFLVVEYAFSTIYSSLFHAKEKPKIPSLLIIFATFLNIFLNYFFIKLGVSISQQYGLVGAAAATLLTRYTNLFALIILARKKLGIKSQSNKILKPLFASLIMLSFLFLFNYFVNISLFSGILMIFIAILIYFFVMILLKGISKEDFKLIKALYFKYHKKN